MAFNDFILKKLLLKSSQTDQNRSSKAISTITDQVRLLDDSEKLQIKKKIKERMPDHV